MLMKNFIVSLAVCLAGCGTTYWEKPGATTQDFYSDAGQCKAQAFSAPGMYAMQVAIIYNSCMQGKGWYTVRE
jgi:hypothetical protein